MKKSNTNRRKISLFGHFGPGSLGNESTLNLGNESTLKAILHNLRQRSPDVEVTCICTGPEVTAATYNIATVPISDTIVKPWALHTPLARFGRKIFIGIPSELYRWFKALKTLKGTDMFIIPGTGLLTDAWGILSWGPYNMFKWALISKLCHNKLLFVSVGAGPLYGSLGRWLVKSALFLADYRSYRDNSTVKYLNDIGFPTNKDHVYPDLAFSLPESVILHDDTQKGYRSVIGIGLMLYAEKYSVDKPSKEIYLSYLETFVIFVKWLLAHDYDIRLLIGDIADRAVTGEFRDLLKERSTMHDEGRIIDEPALSVEHLLSQLAKTDLVVATRFHNVLLALVLNKPVISITFHHKCVSLMSEMGLSEYCQDINNLDADRLIEQFCNLVNNKEELMSMIKQKTQVFRKKLDKQYNFIFKDI